MSEPSRKSGIRGTQSPPTGPNEQRAPVGNTATDSAQASSAPNGTDSAQASSVPNGLEQPSSTPSGNHDRTRGSTSDEPALIQACLTGDHTAFETLVFRYQDRLYNTIARMVGHRDDAAELTQESFVRAFKGLKRFRGGAGFYTWLFRIGVNLAINHRQRRSRVRFVSMSGAEPSADHPEPGDWELVDDRELLPEQQAELNEQHERVLTALESLEPMARSVVILRDIEQLDYAAIAAILEVPVGTVKSRLSRARSALREQLSGPPDAAR